MFAAKTWGPHVPHLSRRAGAIVALITAATFFGGSTVATKAAIDDIPPLTLAFGRFALAMIVLLAVCRHQGVRPVYGRGPALLGLTGIALPFILQNLGLQFSTAVETTLVIEGGLPIASALLGLAVLGERMSLPQGVGMVLAVSGVALILLHGATTGGEFSGTGSLLALGASISFGFYTVIGRRLFGAGFSLPVLTGAITIGVALMAPFALIEMAIGGPGSISMKSGLVLLYLGLGGSAGTQLLWARGMADLDASEVGIFGTLMPVVGISCAAIFLGESVTAMQLGGGAVVLVSVIVTARCTGGLRQSDEVATESIRVPTGEWVALPVSGQAVPLR
jgi:drug/metabolite transporter (DMT)-like permease